MIVFIYSEEELLQLAEKITDDYPEQRNFVLEGDLGAGKTTFVKAFCRYMSCKDEVTSPTFSLVNQYELPDKMTLFHMDLYRLESEDELIDIGFESYLDENAYRFIEWPELGLAFLDSYLKISIETLDSTTRKFSLELIQQR